MPGPACYGQGGTEPTVTDANLIAGRINPDYFLGGEISVSVDLARQAMKPIADRLGVSVEEAALGVIRIANANMINALKLVSVRRGYDPRDFAMIAFGGGGAMHAAALAKELRVNRVVIPAGAGPLLGLGHADDRADAGLHADDAAAKHGGEPEPDRRPSPVSKPRRWTSLQHAGYGTHGLQIVRSLDMRYHGQEHTVRVPVPSGRIDLAELNERFHALHEQAYTFRLDSAIEIVNFHVVASSPNTKAGNAASPTPKPAMDDRRPGEWSISTRTGASRATSTSAADLRVGVPRSTARRSSRSRRQRRSSTPAAGHRG